MKYTGIYILLTVLLLLPACGGKQTGGKVVTVTIEPQRFFAEKIAGDKFTIHCVVPSGQSPETYDPTPKQMVQIGRSAAYLQIGYIGFEQVWMQKIRENNPDLEIFDVSQGMQFMEDTEEEHHHHHHHAGGINPHIWSCIEGAKVIAWNMLNAFIELDKENTEYYWKNYNDLLAEIEETDTEIRQLLDPLTDRTFIIYHPALTYFAAEFDLTQLCIEMDGKEPSPAQLKQLVMAAKEHHTKVVFIQQEFDWKNAELIAKETGCRLVVINPLDYYWNTELIHIAKALADGQTD
ncbi:MAG: zinc ABC transporter substrate-binding protein [Parabacteroides sp.]|nr:zinc ABC transporter substrate-binding protein [Parabacteroides sp.]